MIVVEREVHVEVWHRLVDGRPVPPQLAHRSPPHVWQACCAGLEPAERLHTKDREDLVAALHSRGWTDLEIATYTRMTDYTAARIRARLQLRPNVRRDIAAAA